MTDSSIQLPVEQTLDNGNQMMTGVQVGESNNVFLKFDSNDEMMRRALQTALAAAGIGIWEWNIQFDTVHCSTEALNLLGLPGFSGTLADFEKFIHAVLENIWTGSYAHR